MGGRGFELVKNGQKIDFLNIVVSYYMPRFLCCSEASFLTLTGKYSKKIVS